jgi:hypothetical protein
MCHGRASTVPTRHLLTCKANRPDRRALQVVTRHAAEEVPRKRFVDWHHETDSIPADDREQRITDRLCLGSTIRDFVAEPARGTGGPDVTLL